MTERVIHGLVAALMVAGCVPGDQGEIAVSAGDLDAYRTDVHPLLEASCGTLDCHGDFGRPLRLYAETGLRAADDLRGAPITDDELRADAASLLGVSPPPDSLEDHLALLKPLEVSERGLHHVGRDLWTSRADPAYVCLRAWLEGERAPLECAAAYDRVRLPDP